MTSIDTLTKQLAELAASANLKPDDPALLVIQETITTIQPEADAAVKDVQDKLDAVELVQGKLDAANADAIQLAANVAAEVQAMQAKITTLTVQAGAQKQALDAIKPALDKAAEFVNVVIGLAPLSAGVNAMFAAIPDAQAALTAVQAVMASSDPAALAEKKKALQAQVDQLAALGV